MSLNDGNILFSILQLVPLWPTLDTVADTLLIPKDTEVTEQEDVVEAAAAAAIASVAIIPSLQHTTRKFCLQFQTWKSQSVALIPQTFTKSCRHLS